MTSWIRRLIARLTNKKSKTDSGYIDSNGVFVQTSDPIIADVISRCWTTGKTVVGTTDDEGNIHIKVVE